MEMVFVMLCLNSLFIVMKWTRMLDLKACLVCFNDDVKLYSLKSGNIRHQYNVVSGLHVSISLEWIIFFNVLLQKY